MKIRIWGSRGSLPAPLKPKQVVEKIVQVIQQLPDDIDRNDGAAVQTYVQGLDHLLGGTAGGNTTCVEIEADGKCFVIDAGTGIRELGVDLMQGPFGRGEGELHLFFSHPHWDHIQGFPFFNPAYVPGNRIFIYSVHEVQKALVEQQRFLNFPVPMSIMQAAIEFIPLREGEPFQVGGVRINTIRNAHPGNSYGYRFEDGHSTFVFASDSEYKELANGSMQPHLAFFKDADALVFDAQYTLNEGWIKEDWGHSSAMIGVDMALEAGVKRLLLFHHDPLYDDAGLREIASAAEAYRDEISPESRLEIYIAYEGLALDLTPTGAVGALAADGQRAPILVSTRVFNEQSVQHVAEALVVVGEQATSKTRIIDLSQAETLTTASLKQLVKLQYAEDQVPLILAAPSASAKHVIELGGFTDFFAIYPTVETAQKAVLARESAHLPGQVLGNRYRIESVLAEWRMGTVLGAVDQQEGCEVAVRIIDPAFSDKALDRLFKHRDQLLQSNHPHLLHIHELARDEHTAYVVEDYHPGSTFSEVMAEHPGGVPLEHGLEIAREIADGLAYAHEHGIVHSNLGGEEIFIDDQAVKIGGLGLGWLEGRINLLEAPRLRQDAAYLAPEQILAEPVDARSDLYALGVIYYQLFTGQLPFQGIDSELLQAHLEQIPLPPDEINGQISPSLAHLIRKLMSKNPADRYLSATQVQHILLALSSGEEVRVDQREQALIGREWELGQLEEKWQVAREGRGRLLFISGEQGVGKTCLAEQFASKAQAPVVLLGRCQEGYSGGAFAPFAEALMAYLKSLPPELYDERAQEQISQIASLLPGITGVLPDLLEVKPLEPEQEQMRRMSSITRLISRATAGRPWILILDDLQWADDSSLSLLRYLSFDLAKMPILILGTLRQTALKPGHPLLELLGKLSRHHAVSQIDLNRLDYDGLREIVVGTWDASIPDALLTAIYSHTGGNPLFVTEVMQTLEAEKSVIRLDGIWTYPRIEAVRLPDTVQEVVRRRLQTLHDETQTLLQQAAVLGQSFEFELLSNLSQLQKWPLLEHMELALGEGFVQEEGDSNTYRFQHHEIWLALYEAIPALRRQLWHKAAGEHLEKGDGSGREVAADILATHFLGARMVEKGVPYAYQAGLQAQEAYNNEVAISWYRRLLSALEELAAGQEETFRSHATATLLRLGEVLDLTGVWEEAGEQYQAALAEAQRNGDAEAVGHCQVALGEWSRKRNQYAAAQAYFDQAQVIFERLGDQTGVAQVMHYCGTLAAQQGDDDLASQLYERSLATRRELGEREPQAKLLNNLGIIAKRIGNLDAARSYYEESLATSESLGNRWSIGVALNNLGSLAISTGDNATARQQLGDALAIWREIGERWATTNTLHNLANVAREEGNFQEAMGLYKESLEGWQELDDRWGTAFWFEDTGLLQLQLGKPDATLPLVGKATALREEIGAPRSPAYHETLEKRLLPARQALGEAAADAALAQGQTLQLEEAINLALAIDLGET